MKTKDFGCGAAAVLFLLAMNVFAGCDRAVKVSSFGYDPEDSTRFIQAALDSGEKKIILDRQAGPWYTLPLKMRSNTELVLEPGVELVAKRGAYKNLRDYLLELPHIENASIRGGEGSTLRMWKKDYQGPDYEHGEWRYALRIFNSTNVTVEGLNIVESGGDGIGVSGKDIVIRNCVIDRNHRQGISVFTAENMLIENCILSNTSGTPPAAGIDFEPDRAGERLIDCVVRNCRFDGNDGHGIEIFLNNLKASVTPPVSIIFENCSTFGNSVGVHVWGSSSRRVDDYVQGFIRFKNCTFASSKRPGIMVESVPDRAFDVSFDGCTVSNACAGGGVDVSIGMTNIEQGVPDGIEFNNLKVFQPVKRKWFSYAPQGLGPEPKRISGGVEIVAPGEAPRRETIDGGWIAANMPAVHGGKKLPPRYGVAALGKFEIVDGCPGELAELQPITLIGGVNLLFYADRPGKARFVGRQVIRVAGRKPETAPLTVTAVGADGKRGRRWRIARPLDKSTEFAFAAPSAGFYLLEAPACGTRFALEKSSVPVAIDTSVQYQTIAARQNRPFSLWVDAPGRGFTAMVNGDSYYRFAFRLVDPAGRTEIARDVVDTSFFHSVDAGASKGLWRLDFSKSPVPNYDWVNVSLFNIPGFYFLSPEKRWRSR